MLRAQLSSEAVEWAVLCGDKPTVAKDYFIHYHRCAVVVRVNSAGSEAGADDCTWLATLSTPPALMLSKAESADPLRQLAQAVPGAALLPLIESAAGLLALAELAAAPAVLRLVVGHIDFVADTGIRCSAYERELDPLRFSVALQTRANRLAIAVGSVSVAIHDQARMQADTRRLMNFGFGAKLCIHPRKVAVVHAALQPDAAGIDWARRVLAADAAASDAAAQLDGRMVDLPVVLQARQTLAWGRV